MQHFVKRAVVGAALCLGLSGFATAGLVTFTNTTVDQGGTGYGNINQILGVQCGQPGCTETGSVSWDGVADVLTADATNQSQTLTSGFLQGLGINNAFSLIFNLNESVIKTLTLGDFRLTFQDAAGGSLFDIDWTGGPIVLDTVGSDGTAGGGSGQGNSGWVFDVTLTAAESLQFYGAAGNRLGMALLDPITGASDGPENFFIANRQQQIPEPATLMLVGGALLGLSLTRRRSTRG
jgi:hypothetical protein